jgi:hypothetical protein
VSSEPKDRIAPSGLGGSDGANALPFRAGSLDAGCRYGYARANAVRHQGDAADGRGRGAKPKLVKVG